MMEGRQSPSLLTKVHKNSFVVLIEENKMKKKLYIYLAIAVLVLVQTACIKQQIYCMFHYCPVICQYNCK